MVFTGFFGLWIVYFGVYVFYMRNVLAEGKAAVEGRRTGTYVYRMYGIALMNLLVALTVVIFPIISFFMGIHAYWIALGILYTLLVHFFYMKLMIWGEVLIKDIKNEGNKGRTLQGSNNLRVLGILIIVATLGYFILIVFNAFDILPLQYLFLPPIMPLYYHMIFEFIVLLGVFLLSSLFLLTVQKRIVKIKQEAERENIYKTR